MGMSTIQKIDKGNPGKKRNPRIFAYTHMHVTVPSLQYEILRRIAEKRGVTVSRFISQMIDFCLGSGSEDYEV